MPSFSKSSLEKLETCHYDIQKIMDEVIKHFDFSVICGFRDEEHQDLAFREGNSKVKWPNSMHNGLPSLAIDIAPYPLEWSDTKRFIYLAGFVKGISILFLETGITDHAVRWGGDWNNNTQIKDETFADLGHFELIM